MSKGLIEPEEHSSHETLNLFAEAAVQKAKNEAAEISLREKEMELQSMHALEWLKYHTQLSLDRPKEQRKSLTRLGYIVAGLLIILLLFLSYCLYLEKGDFVLQLIKYI